MNQSQLVAQVLAGDTAAEKEFYDAHVDRVYGLAYRDDLDVREHAVFAISELPEEKAVPALIRIATTNPHLQLRRAALFWLGESDDPRALALFEELLSGE